MTDESRPIAPLSYVKGRNSVPIKPPAPPADDEKRVLLGNAIKRLGEAIGDVTRAGEAIATGLRQGRISAWAWTELTFLSLRDEFWVASPDELARRLATSRAKWFSLSENWIFVDKAAIDSLVRRLSKSGSPAAFIFERNNSRWSLYDACVWVATSGLDTTNDRIAAEDLEEVGAVRLFERLAEQPIIGGIYVFGRLPSFGGRHQVLPGDWDTAHTGWASEGIEVMFREAMENKPGQPPRSYIAADIYQHRLGGPSLTDLWISRDDLYALFPEISGAAALQAATDDNLSFAAVNAGKEGPSTGTPPELKRKPGRKRKYPWEDFFAQCEIVWADNQGMAENGVSFFDNAAPFEREMSEWCENQPRTKWDGGPANSSLREKVSEFIRQKAAAER